MYLSNDLSIYPTIYLSIQRSIYLSIYRSLYLSISLSLYALNDRCINLCLLNLHVFHCICRHSCLDALYKVCYTGWLLSKNDEHKWRWNEEEIFGQDLLEAKVSIPPISKITEHRMVSMEILKGFKGLIWTFLFYFICAVCNSTSINLVDSTQ
jgi:hypothetical protein